MLLPRQQLRLARGAHDKEHAMSQTVQSAVAVIGIDIGKNSFHIVAHDERGALCCARNGHGSRLKHALPICRLA